MNNRLRSTVALTLPALVLALTLAFASIGLAVPLKKGGTYAGKTVHQPTEALSLKVASSGRTVTANMVFPPQFCELGGGVGTKQITAPASISGSGSFHARISYEFTLTHKIVARVNITGRFSGKKATGKLSSEFPLAKQCNGTTSFSARAK